MVFPHDIQTDATSVHVTVACDQPGGMYIVPVRKRAQK